MTGKSETYRNMKTNKKYEMNGKTAMNGNTAGKRRSGIRIMGQLIGLVKPLFHVMTAAVMLGVAGYLCAIFLTVFAGMALLNVLGIDRSIPLITLFVILAAAAVLRGILHYGEQACNHYIAFKLLALIRHKVFAALRRLCPAKLDGRDKGNLISIITSDIELLEVFCAYHIPYSDRRDCLRDYRSGFLPLSLDDRSIRTCRLSRGRTDHPAVELFKRSGQSNGIPDGIR